MAHKAAIQQGTPAIHGREGTDATHAHTLAAMVRAQGAAAYLVALGLLATLASSQISSEDFLTDFQRGALYETLSPSPPLEGLVPDTPLAVRARAVKVIREAMWQIPRAFTGEYMDPGSDITQLNTTLALLQRRDGQIEANPHYSAPLTEEVFVDDDGTDYYYLQRFDRLKLTSRIGCDDGLEADHMIRGPGCMNSPTNSSAIVLIQRPRMLRSLESIQPDRYWPSKYSHYQHPLYTCTLAPDLRSSEPLKYPAGYSPSDEGFIRGEFNYKAPRFRVCSAFNDVPYQVLNAGGEAVNVTYENGETVMMSSMMFPEITAGSTGAVRSAINHVLVNGVFVGQPHWADTPGTGRPDSFLRDEHRFGPFPGGHIPRPRDVSSFARRERIIEEILDSLAPITPPSFDSQGEMVSPCRDYLRDALCVRFFQPCQRAAFTDGVWTVGIPGCGSHCSRLKRECGFVSTAYLQCETEGNNDRPEDFHWLTAFDVLARTNQVDNGGDSCDSDCGCDPSADRSTACEMYRRFGCSPNDGFAAASSTSPAALLTVLAAGVVVLFLSLQQ